MFKYVAILKLKVADQATNTGLVLVSSTILAACHSMPIHANIPSLEFGFG